MTNLRVQFHLFIIESKVTKRKSLYCVCWVFIKPHPVSIILSLFFCVCLLCCIFKVKPVNHCTSVCMHFRSILVDFWDSILMFRSKVVKTKKHEKVFCFFISSVGLSHIWLKRQNLFGNWNISEVYLQFDSIFFWTKVWYFWCFYFFFFFFKVLYFVLLSKTF